MLPGSCESTAENQATARDNEYRKYQTESGNETLHFLAIRNGKRSGRMKNCKAVHELSDNLEPLGLYTLCMWIHLNCIVKKYYKIQNLELKNIMLQCFNFTVIFFAITIIAGINKS